MLVDDIVYVSGIIGKPRVVGDFNVCNEINRRGNSLCLVDVVF